MIRAALLALLVVGTVGGCKKTSPASAARAVRDEICACKDLACLNGVSERYARTAESTRPDEIDPKIVEEVQRCIEKLVAANATNPPSGLPALPAKRDVDALIAAGRAWQQDARMTIANITAEYVDAQGTLDPEYGKLSIAYGVLQRPLDDPKRRTGTPVKADTTLPVRCPTLTFQQQAWTVEHSYCPDEEPYLARCTVAQIWKRALSQRAPADAVAVLTYRNTSPATWRFTIRDEPRRVNVVLDFPDDCERQLEQTP